MTRRYVSNKNESVRMFDNSFMEWTSHIHPSVPVIVFLPVVIWMLYLASEVNDLSPGAIVGLFLFGAVVWTFLEYTLHRFVFHYNPKTAWGQRIHFMIHGVHHDYPNDQTRLVMTPALSIPLAAFFYGLLWLCIGSIYVNATFAGLVFGYLCYDMLHYATHHAKLNRGIGRYLREYHMRHHFQNEDVGYGVTSPIWDYVFGTRQEMMKRRKQAEQRT